MYDDLNFLCEGLIIEKQGMSAVTNWAIYQNKLFSPVERGYQVNSVYMDLIKTFDRMNRNSLMNLEKLGMNSSLLRSVKSFTKGS